MLYGIHYEVVRRVLRETRRDALLSQKELAEKLGREQSFVSRVERANHYIDIVNFLEWCLACNADPAAVVKSIVELSSRRGLHGSYETSPDGAETD